MKITEQEYTERMVVFKWVRFIVIVIALVVFGLMWGCPSYHVYSESKAGEAEYERAVQNRQIQIEEAKAENEAYQMKAETEKKVAQTQAEAEIIRAQGVAKANEIIGNSLKNNEAYLRYLWIQGLQNEANEVIYIPTEANLPILEATRNK